MLTYYTIKIKSYHCNHSHTKQPHKSRMTEPHLPHLFLLFVIFKCGFHGKKIEKVARKIGNFRETGKAFFQWNFSIPRYK